MKNNKKQAQLDIITLFVSIVVIVLRYSGPVLAIFVLQQFGTDIQYNFTNLAVMYSFMAVYSIAKVTLKAIEVVRKEV